MPCSSRVTMPSTTLSTTARTRASLVRRVWVSRAGQPRGVALAVPALVVRVDEREQLGEEGDGLQHLDPEHGVRFHLATGLGHVAFRRVQERRVDADLADVAKERRVVHTAPLLV